MLGGKAESIEEGVEISRKLVADGSAFDRFLAIIKAQGGDLDTVKYPERYPVSKIRETIYAENSGYVSEINGYEIGMALIELGAGRMKKEDEIDHKSGVYLKAKVGEYYKQGSVIGYIDCDDPDKLESAHKRILGSIKQVEDKTEKPVFIKEVIY